MRDFDTLTAQLADLILNTNQDIDAVYEKFFNDNIDEYGPEFLQRVWEETMFQMIELN
jgi:hypothetical protein